MQASFAQNADVPGLGIDLSIAQCAVGDRAAAEATIAQVLRFSPDDALARRRLAAVRSGEEPCGASPQPAPAAATSRLAAPAR